MIRTIFYIVILYCILSCESKQKKYSGLWESIPLEASNVDFVNHVKNTADFNIFSYRNFYNGGGVGIGDINNDGLADIYFTANMGKNRLYLNKGNFEFEDITDKAGVDSANKWSTGVNFIDINNDGYLDIYVSNAGYQKGADQKNELYINNGDLTFEEKGKEYGLDDNGYSTHAAFFDYDKDGDLDAYILNNSFISVNTLNYSNKRSLASENWPVQDFLRGGGDKLLKNDNGVFKNVTEQANIYNSLIGFGLGVTVGDINQDNWPDLYISNDFFERDYIYINQMDGTFKEEIQSYTGHISNFSMGADMADVNNDGLDDIFITDMLPDNDERLKKTVGFDSYVTYKLKTDRGFHHQFMQNTLHINTENSKFKEIARFAGVAASDWSWGALIFDMDNDGLKDLFISNGIYKDITNLDFMDFFANEVTQNMAINNKKNKVEEIINKMPSVPIRNKVFVNQDSLRFKDISEFQPKSFSNGAAYGDLDNDGDLDLVVNNVNQHAFILKNNNHKANFLKVKLNGNSENVFGIGTKLKLYCQGDKQTLYQMPSRGFQSSVGYDLIFGLGEKSKVDSLDVTWSSGAIETIYAPQINKTIVIEEENARKKKIYYDEVKNVFFDQLERVPFEPHKEDDFVDFYKERLVIKGVSREGPAMDIGDVDGDGKVDIFIGGAKGQSAKLYLYKNKFRPVEQQSFQQHAFFEDTEVLLFDADNDQDLDVFIGSGGNESAAGGLELQDRLYLNAGNGDFTLHAKAFSNNGYNTSKAIPIDYDKDGRKDLIVLSRSVPGDYGKHPESYLYHNTEGGTFKNVTIDVFPDLQYLGLLTDGAVINEEDTEVVITGEWMSPTIFSYDGEVFQKKESHLDKYKGWWSAVEIADLDNDGDTDVILGNSGENFYFSPGFGNPVKLWRADFDNNGTYDKIFTRQVNGKDTPVHLKKELTNQIASLRKKSLQHSEFAKFSISELFDPAILKKASVKEVTYFKTAIAFNQGKEGYKMKALPYQAQFSSVRDILIYDINKDGFQDLVLVGNDFDFLPQYGRLDASKGEIFINDGKGGFVYKDNQTTGFYIEGAARDIQAYVLNDTSYVIVGVNDNIPGVFRIK